MTTPSEVPPEELGDSMDSQRNAALHTATSILVRQRRAEQELLSAKQALEERTNQLAGVVERFRLVVESSPNAVLMLSLEGRITLVNAQAENLFGYPREELMGELVEKLVPRQFRSVHVSHRDGFFADPHAR